MSEIKMSGSMTSIFFLMQGRVIILDFDSAFHSIYVILASTLSANVMLNQSILMEKRSRGLRNGGECVSVWGGGELC